MASKRKARGRIRVRVKREYKLWTPPGAPTTGRSRPKIPKEMREEVYRRDRNRCRFCHATTNLTLDHKRPFSKGGRTTLNNLQTLCERCNTEKADYFPE